MKGLIKTGKILLIIVIVLAVLGGLGYAFREPLINAALAGQPGNAKQYQLENVQANPNSPLREKNIVFLGSSVTKGQASLGVSFVEYMEKIDGIFAIKEAVSGTTLVTAGDEKGTSYIPRMKSIDADLPVDCFICQLSTNDASQGKELGTVADGFDIAAFDTGTVAGAVEYIIAYAKDTWNCPVVFYTGTKYDSEEYGKMVDLLLDIQKKWGIGVIDLWNDAEMNSVSNEDYKLFMIDSIHPSQAGYLIWWTPRFESYLSDYLDLN